MEPRLTSTHYIAQVGLELQSSCLLNARITSVCHHAQKLHDFFKQIQKQSTAMYSTNTDIALEHPWVGQNW